MRIVFADDSLLVREGIEHILAPEPDLELVALCEDRDSLLRAVEEQTPDVVLTDVRMPPSNRDEGIAVAKQLRESHPEVGVIVLSQYAEPAYVIALLEAGSARRGYLLKDRLANRRQLIEAIGEVAAGGSVVDPKVVDS